MNEAKIEVVCIRDCSPFNKYNYCAKSLLSYSARAVRDFEVGCGSINYDNLFTSYVTGFLIFLCGIFEWNINE